MISHIWDGEMSYGSISVLQLDVFDDVPSETPLIVASSVSSLPLFTVPSTPLDVASSVSSSPV